MAPQVGTRGHGHFGQAGSADAELGAEGPQHPLAVVPALYRLDHGGVPGCREGGQHQGAFHLGRGHGGADCGAVKLLALDRQGGQVAAAAPGDLGPHLDQGAAHPLHGSASQGAIAREHEVAAGPAGQQAEHQAHGGARVAAIEHVLGFAQAIEAHAFDAHRLARLNGGDGHAHGPQAGGGAEGILGGQQTRDAGRSLGDRAKQQGPVRNRFVARHLNHPLEAAGRLGSQGEGHGARASGA